MRLSSQSIESLHRRSVDGIERCLRYRPDIASLPSEKQWKNARRDERISFELISPLPYSDIADRERGGSCHVFPIRQQREGEEYTAWADYREEWDCVASREFKLVTISWTFYWGMTGHSHKRQLFRANWDGEGAEEAPQPHWHFEAKILEEILQRTYSYPTTDSTTDTADVAEEDGLQELPQIQANASTQIQVLSIGRLHLGMSWQEQKIHPDCWRRTLTNTSIDMVVNWNTATLRHAQKEFERLYIEVI